MKLILARHGETEENTRKIMPINSGKLNDNGRLQAEKLGQLLGKEKIDIVFCSPDLKCQETVKILQRFIPSNLNCQSSELIRERDFGDLSGIPISKVSFDEIDQDTEENQNFGVETLNSLEQRISQFLKEVMANHAANTILIISHTSALNMMLAVLNNISFTESLKKFPLKSAEPYSFDYQSVKG